MQITKKYNKSISGNLIGDIRSLIETARHNVAVTVNAGLTILYWQIGNRIRQDILKEKRADYGKKIVATLSQELTVGYGKGFSKGMLFERTAISKKPEELVKQEIAALREEDKLTLDLFFRDPYFLDFLGLKDTYSEKDLEAAILREMESFILELGIGFSEVLIVELFLNIIIHKALSQSKII